MLNLMLFILFFALAYTVKGGLLGRLFNVDKVSEKSEILDFLLEGKFASGIMLFLFLMVGFLQPPLAAFLFGAAWAVGVTPSMGEEAGAVGYSKYAWGQYIKYKEDFGRAYGVKKMIQRGVFMGALLTLVTGSVVYIPAGALMPVCYFLGMELYYRLHGSGHDGRVSWVYAEPIFGAVIGVAAYCDFVVGF